MAMGGPCSVVEVPGLVRSRLCVGRGIAAGRRSSVRLFLGVVARSGPGVWAGASIMVAVREKASADLVFREVSDVFFMLLFLVF